MNDDERRSRGEALDQMTEGSDKVAQADDACGPEPERPTYYSPQAVRDRWYAWKLCKSGA